MFGIAPEAIFYWTGVVLWALGCTCLVVCLLGFIIVVPSVLIKRSITTLWTWTVCAKLKKYDLTQKDVYDAYQDAYNISDIGKFLSSDRERGVVLKFIKVFIDEMEARARGEVKKAWYDKEENNEESRKEETPL